MNDGLTENDISGSSLSGRRTSGLKNRYAVRTWSDMRYMEIIMKSVCI